MKTSLLRLWLCLGLGFGAAAAMARAQSLSVTSAEASCSAQGGTVTIHVVLNYAGKSPTGLGLELLLPPGWSHQSTFGVNQPEVGPQSGETGSLGWAYVAVPTDAARFSVVLSYPPGVAGEQSLVARPVFRPAPERPTEGQKIVIAGP